MAQKRWEVPFAVEDERVWERTPSLSRRSGMQSTALVISLGLAFFLSGCSSDAADRRESPDAQGSSAGASPVPQAGFGGVVEVTFSTEDATIQDASAMKCGLLEGPLTPLVATPPALPPRTRWYPTPSDVDAAVACMGRQQDVLRVLLPR